MVNPSSFQIPLDEIPESLRMRPGNVVRRSDFSRGVDIMNMPPFVADIPDPQFTLGDQMGFQLGGNPPATEAPAAATPDVFERIENGTLLSSDAQGMLRPSPSVRDVTPNELDEIRQIAVTPGAHRRVRGSWTYDFHLYNSPTQGLILVFVANMSGNEGWYQTTMDEVEQFCSVLM